MGSAGPSSSASWSTAGTLSSWFEGDFSFLHHCIHSLFACCCCLLLQLLFFPACIQHWWSVDVCLLLAAVAVAPISSVSSIGPNTVRPESSVVRTFFFSVFFHYPLEEEAGESRSECQSEVGHICRRNI